MGCIYLHHYPPGIIKIRVSLYLYLSRFFLVVLVPVLPVRPETGFVLVVAVFQQVAMRGAPARAEFGQVNPFVIDEGVYFVLVGAAYAAGSETQENKPDFVVAKHSFAVGHTLDITMVGNTVVTFVPAASAFLVGDS